jgi:hypothetical protein
VIDISGLDFSTYAAICLFSFFSFFFKLTAKHVTIAITKQAGTIMATLIFSLLRVLVITASGSEEFV